MTSVYPCNKDPQSGSGQDDDPTINEGFPVLTDELIQRFKSSRHDGACGRSAQKRIREQQHTNAHENTGEDDALQVIALKTWPY